MTTQAGTPVPPKGKGNDSNHKTWRAGWWDFYPILERPRRPLVWSQSSVIWTTHPTQPLIIGRHFSSSKQFVLLSPTPVISSQGSFDPPTLISVSSSDTWLFAFYPRKDGEGVGCIWKRGAQIDNWQVKEWWNFSKSGGAVAASWLAGPREWATNSSGMPTLLPYRGPTTPVSDPTLVVVTQDNTLIVFYYRYIVSGLRSIKRSLVVPGLMVESPQNFNTTDGLENANGTKHCMDAAISTGYNEASIFIATHSRRVPASPLKIDNISFNSLDLGIPMDMTDPSRQYSRPNDSDTWGEEYTVEVHEAQLRFDGIFMIISLHTFGTLDIGSTSLARISFLCAPPSIPSPSEEQMIRKSPERGHTYLILSTLDFHSYTSPPTSTLTLYSIAQKATGPPGRGSLPTWILNREATRSIQDGVVAHVESFVDFASPFNILMQVYILHHSGLLPAEDSSSKDLPIGTLEVFNIPDLGDNLTFNPTSVSCPRDSVGRDLPLFAAVSPNHRLLCTISKSLWKTRIAIHTLPQPKSLDPSILPYMASKFASAILQKKSTEDIVHHLSSSKIPLSEATDVIYYTLRIFETFRSDLYGGTLDMMGVATEMYRLRARSSKDDREIEMLDERWHTAHDICSVAACNVAFEDCKEGDTYDLEAVWHLIGISTWLINLTEKLMKATVLCNNVGIAQQNIPAEHSLYSPNLLHLTHPFTLQNLIVALKHMKAIRTYIGSLPAGGENPRVAQLILLDAVDCCGIDFGGLIAILEENLQAVKAFDPQVCQRALAVCQPVPAMQSHLIKLASQISDSEKVLNKTTLFIKPVDLVDGVARLSIDQQNKELIDVITKSLLPKQGTMDECLRCGGITAGSKNVDKVVGLPAARWVMWERMWKIRCICGGLWSTTTVS